MLYYTSPCKSDIYQNKLIVVEYNNRKTNISVNVIFNNSSTFGFKRFMSIKEIVMYPVLQYHTQTANNLLMVLLVEQRTFPHGLISTRTIMTATSDIDNCATCNKKNKIHYSCLKIY